MLKFSDKSAFVCLPIIHDTLDNFEEAYCVEWDSEEDCALHIIVEECYNLEKMMDSLANYFDYEAFPRELFNRDYNM